MFQRSNRRWPEKVGMRNVSTMPLGHSLDEFHADRHKPLDWTMPERNKLTLEVYKRVISTAPASSWVVATIDDGKILGVGPTSTDALRNAKSKPHFEREQVVVLWKE